MHLFTFLRSLLWLCTALFLISCSTPDRAITLANVMCIDGIHDNPDIVAADHLFVTGKLKAAAALYSQNQNEVSQKLYCQARLAEMDYYLRELYEHNHTNYISDSTALGSPQSALDSFLLTVAVFYSQETLDTSVFLHQWSRVDDVLGENHYLVNKGNAVLGEYFYRIQFNETLLDQYFRRHQMWNRQWPTKIYDCYWTNLRLTAAGTYQRDHLKSIANCNELIEVEGWKSVLDSVHLSLAYTTRGYITFRFDKFDEAYADNQKAIELSRNTAAIPVYQEALKSQLTVTNFWVKDTLWWAVHDELKMSVDSTCFDYANYPRHVARYYHERKRFAEAIPFQKQAIEYCFSRTDINQPVLNSLTYLLSEEYESVGFYNDAIISYRIGVTGREEKEWTFDSLIDSTETAEEHSFVSLCRYGHIYFSWFLTQENPELLRKSEELALLARSCYYRDITTLEENRLITYIRERNMVLGLLCRIYAEKYKRKIDTTAIHSYHQYAEENRGAIFWKNVRSEWDYDPALVQLLLKQQQYTSEIKRIKSRKSFHQYELLQALQKIDSIDNSIKQQFPEYARTALSKETPGLDLVQDTLSARQSSLLSFDFIDNRLYMLWVTSDTYDLFETEFSAAREEELKQFWMLMSTPNDATAVEYRELAYSVWSWLIPQPLKSDSTKNWIVINDEYLARINLEALVTGIKASDTSYSDLDYLIFEKSITYSLLIKSLLSDKTIGDIKPENIAGMGWSDKSTILRNSTGLAELPGSFIEMKKLSMKFTNVKIYIGKEATKDNFINLYSDPKIKFLQLSLHSESDANKQDDISIYFRKKGSLIDTMYGYELLNFESTIDIVMLTACESGVGKWAKGEGNFNLARYFLSNGAKSVIASKWSLDDTMAVKFDLLTHLYKIGGRNDFLRNSKINIIKNHPALSPYFWGSMICLF